MLYSARPVVVQLFVIMRANVTARESFFQVAEHLRVDGHHVFKIAMDRAILDHQNFAVALDDLRLDLAHLLVAQHVHRQFAVQDLLANLRDALRTQAVGSARPAESRLGLFPGFEQRLVRPSRGERRVRLDSIESLEYGPGRARRVGQAFFKVFYRSMHNYCSSDSRERDHWERNPGSAGKDACAPRITLPVIALPVIDSSEIAIQLPLKLVRTHLFAAIEADKCAINNGFGLILADSVQETVQEMIASHRPVNFALFVVLVQLREVDHLVAAVVARFTVDFEHDFL